MQARGSCAAVCASSAGASSGGGGAGNRHDLSAPQALGPPRAVAALVDGRYEAPLRHAPTWVHERAANAGWRPFLQLLAPPRAGAHERPMPSDNVCTPSVLATHKRE